MEIRGDAVIINSRTYATHHARADLRGVEITLDKRGRRFLPRALIAEWVSDGDEPLRLLYVSLRGKNVTAGVVSASNTGPSSGKSPTWTCCQYPYASGSTSTDLMTGPA